jgi:GNAT superfamily N-acetyltransferase
MTTLTIKTATASNEDPTIAVVVLAFSADPVVRWAYPDPQQYLTNFPGFVRVFAGQAFAQGTAYLTHDYRGAALWLAPSVQPDEEALISFIQQSVAKRNQKDVFAILEQIGSYHPSEPYWFLPFIGVDPLYQSQGLGGILMQHALLRCDRDHLPAYLESSNPRNIPFYKRHRFEELGTIQVGTAPPIIPMVRKPRSA